MSELSKTALAFYEACETGKGWAACSGYCTADASFSAQAMSLGEMKTVEAYAQFMAGIHQTMPDASHELLCLGEDAERGKVAVFGTFSGTHSGPGGPVEPTGKSTTTQIAYIMEFEGGKISHITKVWNDVYAFGQLGWG
jgi:predicted ester cyclase